MSEHQREVLRHCLRGPIAILAGTPGTGKTFTAAQLIAWIVGKYGIENVAVCAPTGKAAVRVSDAMRKYELLVKATTIHRLLRVGRTHTANGSLAFVHGSLNPLPVKFVVVDESSMLDTDLTAALLSACAPGTHVLFVGDPYQLPPVGHGAPLRDMLAAGVPQGELTEVRRNAGMIVHAYKAIKEGIPFVTTDRFEPGNGANFRHLEAMTAADSVSWLKKILTKFNEGGKFDPIWEVQVLVAVNKRSSLCRVELNKVLQGLLNPSGKTSSLNAFRTGDKIICLKNNSSIPLAEMISDSRPVDSVDSYRVLGTQDFIANGEIGCVLAAGPRVTIAQFWAPDRIVRINSAAPKKWGNGTAEGELNAGEAPKPEDDSDTGASTGCDFDLAYACTCHKLLVRGTGRDRNGRRQRRRQMGLLTRVGLHRNLSCFKTMHYDRQAGSARQPLPPREPSEAENLPKRSARGGQITCPQPHLQQRASSAMSSR